MFASRPLYPPIADIWHMSWHVRFVPIADPFRAAPDWRVRSPLAKKDQLRVHTGVSAGTRARFLRYSSELLAAFSNFEKQRIRLARRSVCGAMLGTMGFDDPPCRNRRKVFMFTLAIQTLIANRWSRPPTALLIGSIADYFHRRSVRPKPVGYN